MRKPILLLASITVALVLASGAALAVAPAGSEKDTIGRGTSKQAKGPEAKGADAALDRALKKVVDMPGGPPGVIAVVQRGESRYVHTFGVANLESSRPMRVDDRMRIASAAKAFSGAVALSLVSEGKLSLDDTIGERLPDLPNAWSEVTLRQLLQHTSGIPDFAQSEAFEKALLASLTNAPPPEQLLSFVEDKPLLFEPGSEYRYSNSDNIAVALMVEAATDTTYEQQLRKQVYEPLGLRKTSLPRDEDLEEPFIHGYDNDPSVQPPEDVSELLAAGWAWASGGIVSTPADMNTFIRGYVSGRTLFGSQTREQQRRVIEGGSSEPPGPGKNSAGLAIFRYETKCGTVWGHTGNTLGYTQFMAASPDGRRSVTVAINAQHTPGSGDPDVFKALRRAESRAVCAALADEKPKPPAPKPPAPKPPKNPNACTIKGNGGNNILQGTAKRDVICGFGGNDIIRGLGGNDRILGGGGNDILYGGAGRDRLLGQRGNDALFGGNGRDVLLGGPGKNALLGGPGRDVEKGGVTPSKSAKQTKKLINNIFNQVGLR